MHFELILVYGVRYGSKFIYLHVDINCSCWLLRVKWHRTYKTYETHTRDIHSGQRDKNCASKQARGLFLYSPPGQNSRLYGPNLFSTAHVHKCYHTAKGSEIPAYCSLSRALITRRECFLICKGPLISRLCPSSWQNILFASSTSPLFPYCGRINPSNSISHTVT